MRRSVAPAAAALLAAASVLVTAQPAAADEVAGGTPCSLISSDLTSPNVQSGWLWAGPASGSPQSGSFSIHCTIQVGTADPDGQDYARAVGGFGNPAVLPPTPVRFSVHPGMGIFVCTEYHFLNGGVSYHDADPETEGDQCGRARRGTSGDYTAYAYLPDQLCVWYSGTNPRTEVCIPWIDELFATLGWE